MSTDDEDSSYPRSVRHKQILDKAKANPDASMDELASLVPSATADLVERTLDKYGDPAAAESESPAEGDEQDAASGDLSETEAGPSTDGGAPSTMADATTTSTDNATESPAPPEATDQNDADEGEISDAVSSVDTAPDSEDGHDEAKSARGADTDRGDDEGPPTGGDTDPSSVADDLSPKQREVLELIATNPTATQREIGEQLGVSSATVNNRVNSIDGFEWNDRASFVETVLQLEAETESKPVKTAASRSSREVKSTLSDIEDHLTTLDERVGSLEAQFGQVADACEQSTSELDDPELVHKVVHACLESERMSETEELQLLEQILS